MINTNMNEMRKYLKIMEDISNDLTEEELNSDDLMMMGNYIKNKIVPEIQKNAEVIDMHTELLKEQAGFIQELVEAVNELKGGGSNRTLN